jgi:hypothetical protein
MYDRCSCILALLLRVLCEIRGSTADGRCSALVPQGCFLLGHSFLQSRIWCKVVPPTSSPGAPVQSRISNGGFYA